MTKETKEWERSKMNNIFLKIIKRKRDTKQNIMLIILGFYKYLLFRKTFSTKLKKIKEIMIEESLHEQLMVKDIPSVHQGAISLFLIS